MIPVAGDREGEEEQLEQSWRCNEKKISGMRMRRGAGSALQLEDAEEQSARRGCVLGRDVGRGSKVAGQARAIK